MTRVDALLAQIICATADFQMDELATLATRFGLHVVARAPERVRGEVGHALAVSLSKCSLLTAEPGGNA